MPNADFRSSSLASFLVPSCRRHGGPRLRGGHAALSRLDPLWTVRWPWGLCCGCQGRTCSRGPFQVLGLRCHRHRTGGPRCRPRTSPARRTGAERTWLGGCHVAVVAGVVGVGDSGGGVTVVVVAPRCWCGRHLGCERRAGRGLCDREGSGGQHRGDVLARWPRLPVLAGCCGLVEAAGCHHRWHAAGRLVRGGDRRCRRCSEHPPDLGAGGGLSNQRGLQKRWCQRSLAGSAGARVQGSDSGGCGGEAGQATRPRSDCGVPLVPHHALASSGSAVVVLRGPARHHRGDIGVLLHPLLRCLDSVLLPGRLACR
mmetsp:Transcript_13827/g.34775  ORF Transcript_13827/g.34775 Transcript_13827/m.34775 type:complete len:313 (-) Transcript_13827:496-1434(-)